MCVLCRQDLPYLANTCASCSLPLPETVNGRCGRCQKDPPHYDRTFALFDYATPIDKLVQRLKFSSKLVIARTLGELFAEAITSNNVPVPECIIPVPLHPKRLRKRGFNQAMELVRPVATTLGLTIDNFSCKKILDTTPQSTLPAKQRRSNILHAFSVDSSIKWKRVVIFDDVMTTGQTVNTLAKALKDNGVEDVSIWCIARAIPDHL